jgi:3-oxoacyl-[acyl-carrier-protein] synthase II
LITGALARPPRPLAAGIDASVVSPAAVAQTLAQLYGARGPVRTVSLACASGLAAIAEAARAVRSGACDVALCGGVGADVEPLMLAGFGKLGALSARGVSCPFDVRRDGFVVGEGAAAVVLAAELGPGASAAAVRVLGEGRSLDAYHLTAPDPQGAGAERALRAALQRAGRSAVDYVQAHGTSTPLNDAVEAAALHRVLGDCLRSGRALVSAVKGAVGHWVAGAGAIGFLCAAEAVRSGTVLPTAGLEHPDPQCQLPQVLHTAVQRPVRTALCNAFAFGGANCSVVIGTEGEPWT